MTITGSGPEDRDEASTALKGYPRFESWQTRSAGAAPMIAATDPRLKAIVLMASSASPGRDILRAQALYAIDSMARLTGAARDKALATSQHARDSLMAAVP